MMWLGVGRSHFQVKNIDTPGQQQTPYLTMTTLTYPQLLQTIKSGDNTDQGSSLAQNILSIRAPDTSDERAQLRDFIDSKQLPFLSSELCCYALAKDNIDWIKAGCCTFPREIIPLAKEVNKFPPLQEYIEKMSSSEIQDFLHYGIVDLDRENPIKELMANMAIIESVAKWIENHPGQVAQINPITRVKLGTFLAEFGPRKTGPTPSNIIRKALLEALTLNLPRHSPPTPKM